VAHTAPPTPTRRRFELAFGVVLLLVGVSVAAIAVLALNHPAGDQAAASVTRHPAGTSSTVGSPTSTPTTVVNSATPSPTDSAGTASVAGSGKLPLIVLNNTSDTPASVAADRFRQAGWTVTDLSTFTGAILSTAAYYDPDVSGAKAAATELQQEFPAIHRVKPKFQGLPEGPIVVVLTNDYS
jgi:hypothetical protein